MSIESQAFASMAYEEILRKSGRERSGEAAEKLHRLLVLDQHPPSAEAELRCLLTPTARFQCEYRSWESFHPDHLLSSTARLIAAVAVPQAAKAIGFFEWLRTNRSPKPVLAILPENADHEVLRTVSAVADDFIICPLRQPELDRRVTRILGEPNVESVHEVPTQVAGFGQMLGMDPTFIRAIEKIPRIARNDITVLITGETGTGKELCARVIHHLGKRRDYPFIAVDCSAIPDQLFENELFGHVRGAYTDARADQKGLAGMAEGGTLFLDEVDSLSLASQGKLLRFIQERSYRPLGAERFSQANVNVIAATNAHLESCVSQKRFRRDLYFRLNVLPLELPPLRERRLDIEFLARHFVSALSPADAPFRRSLSLGALRKLMCYDWPGNVRELINVIHRALVFCDGPQVLPEHITLSVPPGPDSPTSNFRQLRARAIEDFERTYIQKLLRKHNGNVTRAARAAGKDRRGFGRLLKRYSIDRLESLEAGQP